MISITRLRLRSAVFLPQFLWFNERSVRELLRAGGFCGGKLLADRKLVFWTVTMWDGETAMRHFRDADAHRKAMPKLFRWCDEASVAQNHSWGAIPLWPEIHSWLTLHGRASRVRFPTQAHASLRFPAPNSPFERTVTPVIQKN